MKKAILFLAVSGLLMTSCKKEEAVLVADQSVSNKEQVIDLVEIYGSEEEAKKQFDLMVNAEPFISPGSEKSELIQFLRNPESNQKSPPPLADEITDMPNVLHQGQTNSCGSFAASVVHSKAFFKNGAFNNNRQRSPWYVWNNLSPVFFWHASEIAREFNNIGAPSLNEMPLENTAITPQITNSAAAFNAANSNLATWGGAVGGGISIGLTIVRDVIHNYEVPLSILVYTDMVGRPINLDANNTWSNNNALINPVSLHYITIYGYDDNRQVVLAQNSWGSGWGSNGGRFEISYAKLEQSWAYNICVLMQVS